MSAAVPAQQCNATFEMFMAAKAKIDYRCPSCHRLVIEHSTLEQQQRAAPAAPVARGPVFDYSKVSNLVKDVRWLKGQAAQTSRHFFSQLEVLLAPYRDFQDSEWVKILPARMENTQQGQWILTHLVEAQPALTWVQIKKRFSEHFDTADLQQETRQEFARCRMTSSESAQDYVTRYLTLANMLGYDKDQLEERTVQEMIDRLQPDLQGAYLQFKANMRVANPDVFARLSSLSFVADRIIELSLALAPNAQRARGTPTQQTSQTGSQQQQRKRPAPAEQTRQRSQEAKHCDNHPNATSHTTEECRLAGGINKEPRRTSNAATAPQERPGVQTRSAAKSREAHCYHCNEVGHIKPNCPQLKSSSGTASDSASQKYGSSGKPPASGPKTPTQRGTTTASVRVHGDQEQLSGDES